MTWNDQFVESLLVLLFLAYSNVDVVPPLHQWWDLGQGCCRSKGHQVIPVVTDSSPSLSPSLTRMFALLPCSRCLARSSRIQGDRHFHFFILVWLLTLLFQGAFSQTQTSSWDLLIYCTVQERGCRFIGGSRHEVPRLRCFWILKLLLQFCFCFLIISTSSFKGLAHHSGLYASQQIENSDSWPVATWLSHCFGDIAKTPCTRIG